VDRLVRRDCTFLLHNRFFEAPPQLAGKHVEVRFDPLDLNRNTVHLTILIRLEQSFRRVG
jgi:Mu transposase, C-terminal